MLLGFLNFNFPRRVTIMKHLPFSFALFFLSLRTVVASDDCRPANWTQHGLQRAVATPAVEFKVSASVGNMGNVLTGEVNCRYWGSTYADVNYYTCTQLAKFYGITNDKFFMLNPDIDPDCGNVQEFTKYCVAGCKYEKFHE
jgi:hypothetical protein